VCLATSQDGIKFNKQLDYGLVVYNGSSSNNIVFSTPYGTGGHKGTGWVNGVTYESRPAVPPEERFKMLYDTDTGLFSDRQLLIATSNDGIHWVSQSVLQNRSLIHIGNFADTSTTLVWQTRFGRYAVYGRADHGSGKCARGGTYPAFREVAMVTAPRINSRSTDDALANFNFSGLEAVVLQANASIDPGCVVRALRRGLA